MNVTGKILCFVVSLILLISCSESVDNYDELMIWLNEAEHGMIQSSSRNGITWQAKLIPHEYMAFQDLKAVTSSDKHGKDSIRASYEKATYVLLTVNSDSGSTDVIKFNTVSDQQAETRLNQMSFSMEYLLTLETGEKKIPAVMAMMEASNGIRTSRDIISVYPISLSSIMTDSLSLTLDDQIFNTGHHRFTFKRTDINAIPKLSL